jgi:hypothetical protein
MTDNELAHQINDDADKYDAAMRELYEKTYQQWRDSTEEIKKALAANPPGRG